MKLLIVQLFFQLPTNSSLFGPNSREQYAHFNSIFLHYFNISISSVYYKMRYQDISTTFNLCH
jgi:hypothetical protein